MLQYFTNTNVNFIKKKTQNEKIDFYAHISIESTGLCVNSTSMTTSFSSLYIRSSIKYY